MLKATTGPKDDASINTQSIYWSIGSVPFWTKFPPTNTNVKIAIIIVVSDNALIRPSWYLIFFCFVFRSLELLLISSPLSSETLYISTSFNPLKESKRYELASPKVFLYSSPAFFPYFEVKYGIQKPTIKKNIPPSIPSVKLIEQSIIVIIILVIIAIDIGAIVWA